MRLRVRGIVAILGIGVLIGPSTVEAQPPGQLQRIAVVYAAGEVEEITEARDPALAVFVAELRRLGYTEGQNLAIERFSGGGHRERYPEIARTVVHSGPRVIFANTGRMALAIRAVTTTIPIVTVTANPVALGLATTLARPGGNVTGFSVDVGFGVPSKRLELLKEAVPRASRVAYLATRPQFEGAWGEALREAAARAGVVILPLPLGTPIGESEYRRAFAALAKGRADALMVSDHGEGIAHARLIVDLAAQARLPAIYAHRPFVEAGGLLVYGIDPLDVARQAAGYVVRILGGARPGDLPFQQPTKFEFVVNLKTARAMNLTMPRSLLLRADQVIQ